MIYLFSYSGTENILTGNVILGTSAEYAEGLPLSGNITISLKHGELLPADSMLVLENEGQKYEYSLKSILPYSTKSGKFYIEGSNIEGQGEGYGEEGEATIYPEVSFVLVHSPQQEIIGNVLEENAGDTNNNFVNESNNELVPEENSSQIASESSPEIQSSQDSAQEEISAANPETTSDTTTETAASEVPVPTETQGEPSETNPEQAPSGDVQSAPLSNFFLGIYNFFIALTPTGKAVDEGTSEGEINGKAASGNPFVYESSDAEDLYLKPGSVYSSGVQISDDSIKISNNGNTLNAETMHSELSRSFGQEYLGNDFGVSFNVDISLLGLLLNKGELKTSLVYNNEELMSNILELSPGVNSNSSNVSNSSLLEVNVTIPANITLIENQTGLNLTAPPLMIITAETTGFVLTESEKALLAEEFGTEEVNTTSRIFNERLFVKNEIGNYWIENSYDPILTEQELDYQMSADRMKWLKDVAYRINAEKLQEQSTGTTESTPIFEP